jgi:lysophospholipase L1-like esterase
MREALKNAALLGAATVVALAVGEAFVRVVAPQQLSVDPRRVHPRGFYAPHPEIGFTMNPAFRGRFRLPEFDTEVAIDSLGIRDREYGPRAEGTHRILVLGDSYTFGWGVEAGERYVDRLEERLNAGGSERWEVVKAGINAYGTREEAAWLKTLGWDLEPDFVIVQFCMGNDFTDNAADGYHVAGDFLVANRAPSTPPDTARVSWLAAVKRLGRERSHLYVLVRDRTRALRAPRAERAGGLDELRAFNRSVDEGLPPTAHALREIAEDAGRRGVPVLVLVVPMRHQIYESRAVDPAVLDHPNAAIAAACAEVGLPIFDLLPAFRDRAARGGPRLYFRVDRHWTREGHRLAGDALSAFFGELRRRGLFTSSVDSPLPSR